MCRKNKNEDIPKNEFFDPTKIGWTRGLAKKFKANLHLSDEIPSPDLLSYRPYYKTHVCRMIDLIEYPATMFRIFPSERVKNLVIATEAPGNQREFAAIMTDAIPDLHVVGTAQQCFPLYYYTPVNSDLLFDSGECEEAPGFVRNDGISDAILEEARTKYPSIRIEKIDLFYYVYGILHSNDYRTKFAADLKLMLARIPLVDKVQDFQKFREHSARKVHFVASQEKVVVSLKYFNTGLFTDQILVCVKISEQFPPVDVVVDSNALKTVFIRH